MVHGEHNKRGGGFALVILGALLFFLAPTVYGTSEGMGIAALAGGAVAGGAGFYKIRRQREK